MEADIYKLITTQFADKTAAAFSTRAYPGIAPENVTYPCAVYEVDSSEFISDFGGDGLFDVHDYSVGILSRQMQEAETETELIKTNLHGFSGTSIAGQSGTVSLDSNIRGIFVTGGGSYFNPETKTYRRDIRLTVHVQRS